MSAELFQALAEALAEAEASSYAGIPKLIEAAEAIVAAEEVGQILSLPRQPRRPSRHEDRGRALADQVIDKRFGRDWSADPERPADKAAELTARDQAARQLLTDEEAPGSAGHLAREVRTLVVDYDKALRRVIEDHAYTLRHLHEHGTIATRDGFTMADGEVRRIEKIPERLEGILDTVTAWANVTQDADR